MKASLLRRITAVFLLFALLLSLTACDEDDPTSAGSSSKAASVTLSSDNGSKETGDASGSESGENAASADESAQAATSHNSASAPANTTSKPSGGTTSKSNGGGNSRTSTPSTPTPSQTMPGVTVVSAAPPPPASALAPIISQGTASLSSNITPLTAIKASAYYGRSKLSGDELKGYELIAAGVKDAKESIDLSSCSLSMEALDKVFEYIRCDYPQYFWLGTTYNMGVTPDYTKVTMLLPDYLFTGSALATAKSKFDAAVNNILKTVSGSWSDYDRERVIHDWICNNVTYTGGSVYAHSAYGALVEHKAVCEGYAEAFQYLLYQAGIPCLMVTGTSKGEAHAWNVVKIGGTYYHVDVTWDDQTEHPQQPLVYHAYFNLSDAAIKEDHAVGSENYALPSCPSMDANYFRKNGVVLKKPFNATTVAGVLRGGNGIAHFYVDASVSEFQSWLNENKNDVASGMGFTGSYTYLLSMLGHEVVVTFKQV